jgi:hypothetical protein
MIEWKQIACVIDREGGGWAKYERYVNGVREEKEEPWGSPPREGERMTMPSNTPGAEGRPSYGPCGRCGLPYKAHAVAHPPMSLARRMALTQCFYITPPRDERPEARCACGHTLDEHSATGICTFSPDPIVCQCVEFTTAPPSEPEPPCPNEDACIEPWITHTTCTLCGKGS